MYSIMTPEQQTNCKSGATRRFAPASPAALMGFFMMLALCLSAALLPGGAQAAFAARMDVLGFSKDGRWFVFEEYGVQDGSGAPFSRVYVIDVDRNGWKPGTPIVEMPRENGDTYPSLASVRSKARARVAAKLGRIDVHPSNGHLMLKRTATDLGADAHPISNHEARFRLWYNFGNAYLLRIRERAASAAPCGMGPTQPNIFTLRVTSETTGAARVLQRDARLPKSRGCALGYGIAGVWLWFSDTNRQGPAKIVVIMHVKAAGFEGHDIRFMAVSGKLPK